MCCLKQHPIQCKYYTNYKRCKFDPCAFLHVEHKDTFENLEKENEAILPKINDIDLSIKALEGIEFETEKFIEKLMEVEKKLDIFTNIRQEIHTKDETIDNRTKEITEMKENLKGKDVLINDLVLRMEVVEGKQSDFEKEVDKEDIVIDKTNDSETPLSKTNQNELASSDKQVKENESNTLSNEKSKDEKVFECDICTYKTKSENGIKIHKAKKHTYPCRNCNQTFTDQDVYQ